MAVCPHCGEKLGPGWVPVETLREPFLKMRNEGVTYSEIARRLGWYAGGKPDTGRLQRTLGLREDRSGDGWRNTRRHLHPETALKLAKALGLDPYEVGL